MKSSLEVLFTPADFSALAARDLSATHCVVYDVLRATTSMLTALANGANSILPVRDIHEAIKLRSKFPNALLAGERDGGQHAETEHCQRDEVRTRVLEQHRLLMLRFWNHEVLLETEAVLQRIWDVVRVREDHRHPGPSPASGRGNSTLQ